MSTNAANALYDVKKALYSHHKILITQERWVDHNRKAVIRDKDGNKFFVLFKREFFLSYGKITGKGGAGESINIEDFDYAVYDLDIDDIIYVYPLNRVYKVRARDIKANSIQYVNESDDREQYLFPVSILQRIA